MEHIKNNILTRYENAPNATHAVVSDGVTEIADGAFRHCEGLRIITIPESVKRVGAYSFADCPQLETIIIPYPIELDPLALGGGYYYAHPRITSTHAGLLDWCSEFFGDELAAGFAYAHYKGIKVDADVIRANDEYLKDYWLGYFHQRFTDEYLLQYILDKRFFYPDMVDGFISGDQCGEKLSAKLLEYKHCCIEEGRYAPADYSLD